MNKNLNEETYTLAVKQVDVRFGYRKSGTLKQISLSTNKVLEMQKNGLLLPEKVEKYSTIELIHDKKLISIPVVKGSGKYCGRNGCLLRFLVEPATQFMRSDIHNWHLRPIENRQVKGAC